MGKEVERATPAKDTVEIVTQKVRQDMLPKAVDQIFATMTSEKASAELRFKAATWIADKYLARADKILGPEHAGRAALVLAETLRDVLTNKEFSVEAVEAKFREIEEREVGNPIVLN